jgi:hypothetical protein
MSAFIDLIRSKDYFKVMFDEFKFKMISSNDSQRKFERKNYKYHNIENLQIPPILLKFIEDILNKTTNTIEVNITETIINPDKINYYGNIRCEIDNYKFIENIYYNVDVINDKNKINIETSIEKKYNEKDINEIDKFFLNIFLFFIENNYTSYVKNEIFKKKLKKINLHSFELNII